MQAWTHRRQMILNKSVCSHMEMIIWGQLEYLEKMVPNQWYHIDRKKKTENVATTKSNFYLIWNDVDALIKTTIVSKYWLQRNWDMSVINKIPHNIIGQIIMASFWNRTILKERNCHKPLQKYEPSLVWKQ